MKDLKFISLFGAAGFIFSFFIGLISKSFFWIVLLRALLFFAVFFALGCLLSYLYNHFVLIGAGSNGEEVVNPSKPGSLVNIVISDEELPSEKNAPNFFIANSPNFLSAEDKNKEEKTAPEANDEKILPLEKNEVKAKVAAETSEVLQNKEEKTPDTVSFTEKSVENKENQTVQNDEEASLPELENIEISNYDSQSERIEPYIVEGSNEPEDTRSSAENSGKDDTVKMARAISTLLAKS